MADEKAPTVDELVKKFQAIEKHSDRCKFFHDNFAALATIFRPVHFPKPDEPAVPSEQPVVTA